MTPLDLSILIHYKGHARDFQDGDFSAPAVRQAIDCFKDTTGQWTVSGMLEQVSPDEYKEVCYRLTKKGHVFVDALCDLKPPVQIWVMSPNVELTSGAAAESETKK